MNSQMDESIQKRIERAVQNLVKFGYGEICSNRENELGICLYYYEHRGETFYLGVRGLEWGGQKIFFKDISKVEFASLREISQLGPDAKNKDMDIELFLRNGERIRMLFPFPVFSILATLLHQLAELSENQRNF
ncbi:hypothetical protein EHQ52_03175 [Leptospira koniambonensis]|uniref:Uncharacterized protein n=1 Tax=Leptospira koniambonensis TaxID=2484950 RepID=A0A4R9JE73_9LEPT|nr:hypothetical protein [Leptospira koniambonensis]TGL36888.1 hypothetical protein EHQ52_03175 [Leptospira koniambonensis]